MGRVGSGKTTLLRALVRLIDAPQETVSIDEHDVFDYPLSKLRAQIALVPQDPFLFAETLHNNITYDNPDRTLDAIWHAADAADLRRTLEGFPDGLDTLVGERGVTLSGGQKQRTTLARGLIRDAPVLLLDDCFASVDTATEEHISTPPPKNIFFVIFGSYADTKRRCWFRTESLPPDTLIASWCSTQVASRKSAATANCLRVAESMLNWSAFNAKALQMIAGLAHEQGICPSHRPYRYW